MTNITRAAMVADAANYVVVDDGQYRYPVAVEDLRDGDTEEVIRAMSGDEYGEWCNAVPADQRLYMVGDCEMIALCQEMIESGADVWHVG